MSTINNGGPAFPLPFNWQDKSLNGMTLRDYFAARAMAEMNWKDFDGSARECYEIADAMLKARQEK